jgi:hypothetical protein
MDNTRYGKYMVTTLQTPANFSDERITSYAWWAKRIPHLKY